MHCTLWRRHFGRIIIGKAHRGQDYAIQPTLGFDVDDQDRARAFFGRAQIPVFARTSESESSAYAALRHMISLMIFLMIFSMKILIS